MNMKYLHNYICLKSYLLHVKQTGAIFKTAKYTLIQSELNKVRENIYLKK